MTTWRQGSRILAEIIANSTTNLETFIGRVKGKQITRVPGTAVFITSRLEPTPPSLHKLVRHTGVLYERVILVAVVIEPIPFVNIEERIELEAYDEGFYRIILRYGFMHTPNIPSDLKACAELGLHLDLDEIHYIVGHVDLLAGRKMQGMVVWRD